VQHVYVGSHDDPPEMSTRARSRVGQEAVEVVLTELTRDQGWNSRQVEISAVGSCEVLRDGEGEHAVDIDVGAAGQLEQETNRRGLGGVEDATKVVTQYGGGGVCDGPDDADLRRPVGVRNRTAEHDR
jgi:hypothetical protein